MKCYICAKDMDPTKTLMVRFQLFHGQKIKYTYLVHWDCFHNDAGDAYLKDFRAKIKSQKLEKI